jgi:putative phage-type endonuclease
MKIIECEQNTPEWFKIKCGVPSASNFDKIVTTSGDKSKSTKKYMYQLAGEKITGVKEETYQNAAMLRGIELEPEARNYYELLNDVEVQQVGFCLHDKEHCGCSPDGLVGEHGLIEIKCRSLAVHVECLINNKLPTIYFQQVQGQLYVTGREWCDFMSYYPGDIKQLIVRVYPDKLFQKSLEIELNLFCDELNQTIERIK